MNVDQHLDAPDAGPEEAGQQREDQERERRIAEERKRLAEEDAARRRREHEEWSSKIEGLLEEMHGLVTGTLGIGAPKLVRMFGPSAMVKHTLATSLRTLRTTIEEFQNTLTYRTLRADFCHWDMTVVERVASGISTALCPGDLGKIQGLSKRQKEEEIQGLIRRVQALAEQLDAVMKRRQELSPPGSTAGDDGE